MSTTWRVGHAAARRWFWVWWGLLLIHLQVLAQGWRIEPPQTWVDTYAIERLADAPPNEASAGPNVLLFDQQVRSGVERPSTYRRFVLRPEQPSALESAARIELGFNPQYQQLAIHHVRVWRQGKPTERLQRTNVQLLHRERELERRVLDGSRTAYIELDDVRVGDIVDYAFTITGTNPAFGSQRFGRFDLQWSSPVFQLRQRLLWPRARPLNLLRLNAAAEGTRKTIDDLDEYLWERQQVPALTVESDAPGWHDPYPAVHWGDYASWQQVASWGEKLYRVPATPPTSVLKEAARIRAAHTDDEQRIAAVLRFVQSEIRYLSMSVGSGSYVPRPPQEVLASRFGDCKDKTLLMVTLLRAMNVEATPALVNTVAQRGIAAMQPSPLAFDHVLVHVQHRGRSYWLDPTRDTQHGRLDRLYQPHFGLALPLRENTPGLVDMAASGARLNLRDVQMTFDASQGIDQPAQMQVTTRLEGLEADRLRSRLATQTRAELQKTYLGYYAQHYAGLTPQGELEVSDDRDNNRLTLVERYRIPQLWQAPEGKTRRQAHFPSTDVEDHLRRPRDQVRQAPLRLSHPVDVRLSTEILLPQDWTASPAEVSVRGDAFAFESKVVWPTPRRVLITDRYMSLADSVAADRVAQHDKHIQQALSQAGYTLFLPAEHLPGINWTVWMAAVMAGVALLWGARRLYTFDPAPRPAPELPALRGIRGWLLVAVLLAGVGCARVAWALWRDRASYGLETWVALTSPDSPSYHALWAPLLLYELCLHMMQLVLGLLTLLLILQKRSSAPHIWTTWVWAATIGHTVDTVWASQLPPEVLAVTAENWRELFYSTMGSALWTAYFWRSRRVALTCVERLRPTLRQAPVRPALDGT